MAQNLWVADGWVQSGWIYEGVFVDWPRSVIFIPKLAMTLVQTVPIEVYNLDMNQLHLTLRELEEDPDGRIWPTTHGHNTEVLVGGLTLARVIEIFDPYTVTFEDGQYAVNIVQANTNLQDKVNINNVSVRPNNSAGLINLTELQQDAFGDGVTYDETSTFSNSVYPNYSKLRPGNNLVNAQEVAAGRGFENIYLKGNLTVQATESIAGYHVHGLGATLNLAESVLTYVDGCSTHQAHIYNCQVTGFQGGENYYNDCIIDGLVDFHCTFIRCGFKTTNASGYTIKQSAGPGSGHVTYFKNCFSDEGVFIVDRDGAKTTMIFDEFHGHIKFINNNNATAGKVSLHMNGGTVELDATCTEGSFEITGDYQLIDNSGVNCTVYDHAANFAVNVDTASIAAAVEAQLLDDFAGITVDTGAIALAVETQLANEFAAIAGNVDAAVADNFAAIAAQVETQLSDEFGAIPTAPAIAAAVDAALLDNFAALSSQISTIQSDVTISLNAINQILIDTGTDLPALHAALTAQIAALNDFNPATDPVATVTTVTNAVTVSNLTAIANQVETVLLDNFAAVNANIDAKDVTAIVNAVKGVTDQMVFTVANQLDVNVRSKNSAPVFGTGISADKWRGGA